MPIDDIHVELTLLSDCAILTFDKFDSIVEPYLNSPIERVQKDFKKKIDKERNNKDPITRDNALELISLLEKQFNFYYGVEEGKPSIFQTGRAAYVKPENVQYLRNLKDDLLDLRNRASEIHSQIVNSLWPEEASMPDPDEVNPRNFKVKEIIYNLNTFSIAWGEWQDGSYRLAMRWNGLDSSDKGYPKTFGNPVWFMLPQELSLPFLQTLGTIDPSYRGIAD